MPLESQKSVATNLLYFDVPSDGKRYSVILGVRYSQLTELINGYPDSANMGANLYNYATETYAFIPIVLGYNNAGEYIYTGCITSRWAWRSQVAFLRLDDLDPGDCRIQFGAHIDYIRMGLFSNLANDPLYSFVSYGDKTSPYSYPQNGMGITCSAAFRTGSINQSFTDMLNVTLNVENAPVIPYGLRIDDDSPLTVNYHQSNKQLSMGYWVQDAEDIDAYGAIWQRTGNLTIKNVTIRRGRCDHLPGYSSAAKGGAIQIGGRTGEAVNSCTIQDCAFYDNYSANRGGGIFIGGSVGQRGTGGTADNITISRCYFTGNSVLNDGGACYVSGTTTSIEFDYLQFISNESTGNGAALYIDTTGFGASKNINRCRINNNTGPSIIHVYRNNSENRFVIFKNCLINGNVADYVFNNTELPYARLQLMNCSIVDNTGIGLYSANSTVSGGDRRTFLRNSIVRGNTIQISGPTTYQLWEKSNNNIEGSEGNTQYTSVENIDTDPGFLMGLPELYYPNGDTATIDGGSAALGGYDAVDLTGFTRTGTPDMGCIEKQGALISDVIPTNRYHLQLNAAGQNGNWPMSFLIPYKLQNVDLKRQSNIVISGKDNVCSEVQFASEYINEKDASVITEFYDFAINKLRRIRLATQATVPNWGVYFMTDYRSDEAEWLATTGRKMKGEKVKHQNMNIDDIFTEILQYSITFAWTGSRPDYLANVFNVFLESMPEIERDVTTLAAKWLKENECYDPDEPLSTGVLQELVRLLTFILYETRSPLTCPLFGIYPQAYTQVVV